MIGMAKRKPERRKAPPGGKKKPAGSWAARVQTFRLGLTPPMSQADLASFLGVPLRTVVNWENSRGWKPNACVTALFAAKFPDKPI